MNASLGTKRICPHCATKFYDFAALEVKCPKCGHAFPKAKASKTVVKPVIVSAPPKKKKAPPREEEQDFEGMSAVVELEELDDFDDADIDHLEEVEDHLENPEVDVNSDDAEDDMFIDEIAEDDLHLVDEPDYDVEERGTL